MLRVVCVDDDTAMLHHLVFLCERIAEISSVEGFEKPEDSLEWIREHPCDLALLDIDMPDMDGIMLAQKIREIRPRVYIVFITGHTEYTTESWEIHPQGYLLKPITKSELQEEVERINTLRATRRRE